jgi:RHS repeat-associated protein
MADPSGAVVWSATYTSFGKAHVDPGSTVTNNLRFPGQYFDDETNNHYNYNRYYDHNSGRYLRRDPIGIAGGVNHFLYSFQNPIVIFDPFGLFCKIEEIQALGPRIGDTWLESQKIGYWQALSKRIVWEIIKIKLKASPIPGGPEEKLFKYKVRYTEYERRLVITKDFFVCYDDCTKDEVFREYIGESNFGKTEIAIVSAYEVDKYIGDSKEYNRNDDVDPLVIKEQ